VVGEVRRKQMSKVAFVLADGHARVNVINIFENEDKQVGEVEIACEETGKLFMSPYVLDKNDEMKSEIHFKYCPLCGKKLVKETKEVTLDGKEIG